MKRTVGVVWLCWVLRVAGASMSQDAVLARAYEWMAGNPLMSQAIGADASVDVFTGQGGYSVYLMRLTPSGYLVLNSDDRLPLVVSWSADSSVDLTDSSQNAFRELLLSHCERVAEELLRPIAMRSERVGDSLASPELYGPFLETSWGQSAPYNALCPDAVGGGAACAGRAPVGCVPVAYAQIMQFHRWPVRGMDSHEYVDNEGGLQGVHYADFSDAYDWKSMRAGYSLGTNLLVEVDAVAELMLELGVAAEINYEVEAASSSSETLGARLRDYFFFEPMELSSSQSGLIAPMEADLRSGFPCVVSYPGHAFVADGLLVEGGTTMYHFNMGWGGVNNGWWLASAVPTSDGTSSLDSAVTTLRPRLMAFPQTNTVCGEVGTPVDLDWILPKRRESEAAQLEVVRLEHQEGGWSSDATEICEVSSGWDVVPEGRSGEGWFAACPQSVTVPESASMVLDDLLVPDQSTVLSFWHFAQLAHSPFTIDASADGGRSYDTIFSTEETLYEYRWSKHLVSLASYAGQQIQLRFRVVFGGWYSSTWSGIRLDDLAVSSGEWFAWKPFAVDNTLAFRRFAPVVTPVDDCDDFSVFEPTTTGPVCVANWAVTSAVGVASCFYKAVPEYSGVADFLTSRTQITPTATTRLCLRAKYQLASGSPADDQFRISVSTNRIAFEQVWAGEGAMDWADLSIDLSAYAGRGIYIRFEYVGGYFVKGGGVWIDSICTQEVSCPELEGQPILCTTLTNLSEGAHTLAARVYDRNLNEHAVGPSFVLNMTGGLDDGDGIPSAWEALNGLDSAVDDGNLDPDDDGYSNWEEYLCNTSPTNSASCWGLEVGEGGQPCFLASSGRVYTVKYCTHLASNDWVTLGAAIRGSNCVIQVDDAGAVSDSVRFYQVDVGCLD